MTHDDGIIVPLAWPETKAIKEGKWYDYPMEKLGFIKNGFWHLGHAAMLLIQKSTGAIYYSDFGRYHTPHKHGRVRIEDSDPDIKIPITAIFNQDGTVANIEEILDYLYIHEANHGEGYVIAALQHIDNFTECHEKSLAMHEQDAIPYGPFAFPGTNCSRYVAQVSLRGNIGWWKKFLLRIPYTVTPTPISNVRVINSYAHYYKYDGKLHIKNSIHFSKKKLCTEEQ